MAEPSKMHSIKNPRPIVVSFGGGVDSSAMLIGLYLRCVRPDGIVFADTGGELPEVYEHVGRVQKWLSIVDFPEMAVVRYESQHGTLEQECINNETLPSKAFGNAGCSVKWKRQPIDKWVKVAGLDWSRRIRMVGINFDEVRRGQIESTDEDEFTYPLREWKWGREMCRRACLAVFGYVPHKSACFYCPAMRKREVIELSKTHPELAERAKAMEANAAESLTTCKGLGRAWSWTDLLSSNEKQRSLFHEIVEPHCVGECDT